MLNWLIYYPSEYIAARWTDELITINEEDYKRALTMGYRKKAVHYVHGVGVKPIENRLSNLEKTAVKKSLGLPEDAFVISYIAEINKNKNHNYLLRNWNKIKEKIPKATLLVIGEGDLLPEIRLLLSNELMKDVYLLGYRNDVNDLLEITDVGTGCPTCRGSRKVLWRRWPR